MNSANLSCLHKLFSEKVTTNTHIYTSFLKFEDYICLLLLVVLRRKKEEEEGGREKREEEKKKRRKEEGGEEEENEPQTYY